MTDANDSAALRAADAAARAEAQREYDRPIVVEAGAGTGKTGLLVARIVAWSLDRGWVAAEERIAADPVAARDDPSLAAERVAADVLSRVAAITFTESAAAEMARRTGAALVDIEAGQVPVFVDEKALPDDSAVRRARARVLVGALDHLAVQTIHSFCRGLLAQHPLQVGLHPGFEVDADNLIRDEVVREVVEEAVQSGYGDPGDDDWIALAVDGVGPAEIEQALADLLDAGASPETLADEAFPERRTAEWIDDLARAVSRFGEAEAGCLVAAKRSTIAQRVRDAVDATAARLSGVTAPTLAEFDALVVSLSGVWEKKLVERLREWADGVFKKSEEDAAGDRAEAISGAAAGLADAVAAARELAPLKLERARRCLLPLLDRAREAMRVRGAVNYDALLREARDLLRDHANVRRRVRSDLDQLLVDEFQDTDPLQCDIIRWIALDDRSGDGPGLFLVGDPKQSIYGWRRADLRAYQGFVDEVLGRDREPARLSVNFRSRPEILDEVTRVIEPVMRAEAGLQPRFERLVPSAERAAAPRIGPCVEHWVSWRWDDEEAAPDVPNAVGAARLEAEALARDLVERRAERKFAWSDVGVLFRSTGDQEIYLAAMRAAGVPYAVERDRAYYRRREIIDASALVRCVLDCTDHVALLAWLRSAVVGVPDAALLPLWSQGLPDLVTELRGVDPGSHDRLDRAIAAAVAATPRDVPGIERVDGWDDCLRQALVALGALRASFDADPADVFVEKLRVYSLIEPTEAARFLGAFRVANLDQFFRDLVTQLESTGDRETLLRRLRTGVAEAQEATEARPSEAAEDAVRVMTIHKAKGLDFTHTYIVQLHKKSGGSGRSLRTVVGSVSDGFEYRLFGAPTLGFREVEEQAERVENAERVRLLYVAITRAKERLVLMGKWAPDHAPVEPGAAKTHLDLLASRRPGVPDLGEAMCSLVSRGAGSAVDTQEALWRFPALESAALALPADDLAPPPLPTAEVLRSEARLLRVWCQAAERRSARPWNARPSADSHAEHWEERAERRFDRAGASDRSLDPGRAAAIAAGVAVHRVLEEFDLDADPDAELDRQSRRLGAWLRATCDDEAARIQAVARAQEVLAGLRGGPLLARLCSISEHVVARELPVVLPPSDDDDGAVGFVAGSIDLCYRDPEAGEWVVADYKTDRAATPAAVAEIMARYASQGRAYQRAVREAMHLDRDPRFELWLLDAGRIETIA
ncbi:MAG: UvrD-helicase domain-containing protein [Myxococcota bacterium]